MKTNKEIKLAARDVAERVCQVWEANADMYPTQKHVITLARRVVDVNDRLTGFSNVDRQRVKKQVVEIINATDFDF